LKTPPARYDHHTGFPIDGYLNHQQFAPTCCLFVRRDVFEDVGLFDPRLVSGGDKEFGNRVDNAGYNQQFAEDVEMYHPTRNSLDALVSKDRRVGRGLCQLQRYHPNRYGTPVSHRDQPGSSVPTVRYQFVIDSRSARCRLR